MEPIKPLDAKGNLLFRPGRKLRDLYILEAIDIGLANRQADETIEVARAERTFARRIKRALIRLPEELKRELIDKKQTYYPNKKNDFPFTFSTTESAFAADAIWNVSYEALIARNSRKDPVPDPRSSIAEACMRIFQQHAGLPFQ